MAILKNDGTKKPLNRKRLFAGWNDEYLWKLLTKKGEIYNAFSLDCEHKFYCPRFGKYLLTNDKWENICLHFGKLQRKEAVIGGKKMTKTAILSVGRERGRAVGFPFGRSRQLASAIPRLARAL